MSIIRDGYSHAEKCECSDCGDWPREEEGKFYTADDLPYAEDVIGFGNGRVFVTDLADMDGEREVPSEIERLTTVLATALDEKRRTEEHLRKQVYEARSRARQNALMAEDVSVIKSAEYERLKAQANKEYEELQFWRGLDEKQKQLQAMAQQPLVKKIPTRPEIDLDELGIHVELHHRIGYIVMVEQTRRTFSNGYRTWWRPTRALAERKGSSERLKDIQRDEPWQRRRGDMSDEEWRAQLDARDHYEAMLHSL